MYTIHPPTHPQDVHLPTYTPTHPQDVHPAPGQTSTRAGLTMDVARILTDFRAAGHKGLCSQNTTGAPTGIAECGSNPASTQACQAQTLAHLQVWHQLGASTVKASTAGIHCKGSSCGHLLLRYPLRASTVKTPSACIYCKGSHCVHLL